MRKTERSLGDRIKRERNIAIAIVIIFPLLGLAFILGIIFLLVQFVKFAWGA